MELPTPLTFLPGLAACLPDQAQHVEQWRTLIKTPGHEEVDFGGVLTPLGTIQLALASSPPFEGSGDDAITCVQTPAPYGHKVLTCPGRPRLLLALADELWVYAHACLALSTTRQELAESIAKTMLLHTHELASLTAFEQPRVRTTTHARFKALRLQLTPLIARAARGQAPPALVSLHKDLTYFLVDRMHDAFLKHRPDPHTDTVIDQTIAYILIQFAVEKPQALPTLGATYRQRRSAGKPVPAPQAVELYRYASGLLAELKRPRDPRENPQANTSLPGETPDAAS